MGKSREHGAVPAGGRHSTAFARDDGAGVERARFPVGVPEFGRGIRRSGPFL